MSSLSPIVTLDSAFQHPIGIEDNKIKLDAYTDLKQFIRNGDKIIGLTITDLQWNSLYKNNLEIENKIRMYLLNLFKYVTSRGFKILFIPTIIW